MDYIVALGNGMILKNGYLDLLPESKITALAAGVVFKKALAQKIILSGGHTKGKDKESEAKKMLEFIRVQFPDISESAFILEEASLDTSGNALETKKLLPQDSRFILLSFAYHLPRARRIFKNFGLIPEKTYASDTVLKDSSPIYDEYLKHFTLKRKSQKLFREIICLTLVYTIDPKGKILRMITSRTRGGSLSFIPF